MKAFKVLFLHLILFSCMTLSANAQANVEFYGDTVFTSPGSTVTMRVRVKEFWNVVQVRGSMHWDTSLVEFDSVSFMGLPYMDMTDFDTTNAFAGTLTWDWMHLISIGGTLSDWDPIFSIDFRTIGPLGSVATITMDSTPLPLYWYNFSAWSGPIETHSGEIRMTCAGGPTPTADFTFSGAGLSWSFDDTTSGGPTSWFWDFDDGTTDTTANPSHTFASPGVYNVCLRVENGCGSYLACHTVNALSTRMNMEEGKSIQVYPNPSSGEIMIALGEAHEWLNIEVTDLLGRSWRKEDIQALSGSARMDLYDLPKGLYFLNIRSKESTYLQKVILR